MCRKNELTEDIRNLGYVDLIKHFQTMDNYLLKLTVDEFATTCSDYNEDNFLYNKVAAEEFTILNNEETDEARRFQWLINVWYVDSLT